VLPAQDKPRDDGAPKPKAAQKKETTFKEYIQKKQEQRKKKQQVGATERGNPEATVLGYPILVPHA
jgi:hypothetical protein